MDFSAQAPPAGPLAAKAWALERLACENSTALRRVTLRIAIAVANRPSGKKTRHAHALRSPTSGHRTTSAPPSVNARGRTSTRNFWATKRAVARAGARCDSTFRAAQSLTRP